MHLSVKAILLLHRFGYVLSSVALLPLFEFVFVYGQSWSWHLWGRYREKKIVSSTEINDRTNTICFVGNYVIEYHTFYLARFFRQWLGPSNSSIFLDF